MSLGPPKKDMTPQLTESDRHSYQPLYKNIDPHSGAERGMLPSIFVMNMHICHEGI